MKKTTQICWLASVVVCSFFSQTLQGQVCTSSEYIYVNDISFDVTHKFRVNANGSLTEIPNGATGTVPWMPANTILDPHGVSMDRNGFIYMSEFLPGSGMVKADCDGNIIQGAPAYIENAVTTNHVIIGNYLYAPEWFTGANPVRVNVYNLCDGSPFLVGYIQLGGVQTVFPFGFDNAWGISYNANDGLIYISDNYFNQAAGEGEIFAVSPLDPESPTSVWQTHAVINPVISGLGVPMGITFDDQNNMYFNDNGLLLTPPQTYSRIYRYSLVGGIWTQTSVLDDPILDGTGWYNNWGITWSRTTNNLYVTSWLEDCVAVIDAATMTYQGVLSIPHIPGGYAKAINIIEEGCITPGNQILNVNVCPNSTEPVLLRDLLGCPVCGGVWTRTGGTGGTFNACDLTFDPTGATSSQFTFVGGNQTCGNFSLTVNVNIADLVLATAVTCNGATANINLTVTNGLPPFTFQWSNGATTEDLTNVPNGNYMVTVTDATGVCGAMDTATVNCQQPCPTIPCGATTAVKN